jgi:hypothetical protein
MKMDPQRGAPPILWTKLKRDLKQSQRDRIFEQYAVERHAVLLLNEPADRAEPFDVEVEFKRTVGEPK